MQTTVQVAFVNQPKQAGWSGSIKTKAGDYFSVKEKDLTLFEQGKSYAINYVETAKDGRIFKNFVSLAEAPSPAPAASPMPAPMPAGHNGHAALEKDKLIFVTGVVGRAMGSGKFTADEIGHLTAQAVIAWDALNG